ncbi:hypothetical protein [Streptomyces tubercidicus]|uniref:hypothetical protein n=1 Tax=Streptomyces tubercidicus TaxID=47759 RepID=UPI0034654CEE
MLMPLADDWLAPWFARARTVLNGEPMVALLADLATAAPLPGRSAARIINLPLQPAASALSTTPHLLAAALLRLAEAGLLTCTYDGEADSLHATITLLSDEAAPGEAVYGGEVGEAVLS